MADLFICTTVARTVDGEPTDYEAIVFFSARQTSRGCLACYYQANGDPGWPAEPAEFEFAFERAELDPSHRTAPPLTDAELATLRAWFVTRDDQAQECANDNYEPDSPDPDDLRELDPDDDRGWRGLEA